MAHKYKLDHIFMFGNSLARIVAIDGKSIHGENIYFVVIGDRSLSVLESQIQLSESILQSS